ncbi:MAG: long-chain fatty acid--CoA ligase [Bacteroidales bacterium]|nr:long-chain fatty acid--CoA ligase [Bacteroidales bacterium]
MENCHLAELVHRQADKYKDRTVLRYRDDASGKWNKISWRAFSERIMLAAKAMAEFGVEECENIGIYSQNMPQYLITDFAAFANRAVMVPLYATSSPSQIEYIVEDAKIRFLFAGEQFQYNNAFIVQRNSSVLKRIIVFDRNVTFHPDDKTSVYFDDFVKMGDSSLAETTVKVRMMNISGDDLATIIYTSGTTGEPKGVMLKHSSFMEIIRIHDLRLTMLSDKDHTLCFLPLAHIFEKAWSYYCLHVGMKISINRDPKEIQKIIKEVNPTAMCSVPRFWEKVYIGVNEVISGATGIKKWLFMDSIRTGKRYNLDYKNKEIAAPLGLKIKFWLYDKTVFTLLRKVIGINNGNIFPCAGAPLSDEINEFLHSVNIPLCYGYGLSETTATVSCFLERGFTFGTVGTIMPGVDVKIGENSEILVKGKTVTCGYYNKPQATADAFIDGWFRTGDAGKLTDKNEIILTERIKDLFKTSNGKYIAPQALESRIAADKYIEQIAVIGDKRKFVSALVVPAFPLLKEYAESNGIKYNSTEELVQDDRIHRLIESHIEELQKGFASFEKIKRFTLLPKAFTMEAGEITNTLKFRRAVIQDHYAAVIDEMYIEEQ